METNIQTTVNNKKLSHPTYFDHLIQKLPTVDSQNSYQFKQFNWQSSHRLHNRTETHSSETIEREKKKKNTSSGSFSWIGLGCSAHNATTRTITQIR